jgi:hypothetical protein
VVNKKSFMGFGGNNVGIFNRYADGSSFFFVPHIRLVEKYLIQVEHFQFSTLFASKKTVESYRIKAFKALGRKFAADGKEATAPFATENFSRSPAVVRYIQRISSDANNSSLYDFTIYQSTFRVNESFGGEQGSIGTFPGSRSSNPSVSSLFPEVAKSTQSDVSGQTTDNNKQPSRYIPPMRFLWVLLRITLSLIFLISRSALTINDGYGRIAWRRSGTILFFVGWFGLLAPIRWWW